jgi:type I restriction enzyme M protein
LTQSGRIVQKLWSYCNVLRDDGLSYQDYLEQLTFLLFLKMADERAALTGEAQAMPKGYRWQDLANPQMEGVKLEQHYRETLRELGTAGGMLGLIFEKAQNKIQDPAKLRQLIVELIGKEQWLSMSADVKGDAYEGLLEKNASDVKGGAGQYFTPRSVIQAMVDCVQPRPGEVIVDPAAGTGGFLLAARDYLVEHHELNRDQKRHLRFEALRGVELVPGVSRLCAMNLFLHGIGPDGTECQEHKRADFCPEGKDAAGHPLPRPCHPWQPPITTEDALRNEPAAHADVVLTNPPFGKKSSVTVVNEAGETDRETLTYNRQDFWTTTSNKQLNFVQHVKSLLEIHGRAAVVVPDNVLFEGGAGETVRRRLLHECDVHTLLRLPTGIFYAQGVKANVLFFDRKPGAKDPWTKTVWVYDLRTNKHFTLKQRTLTRADLDEFVSCYKPGERHKRKATWSDADPDGRWRPYTYEEILNRDKVSLDLFWLRDESLEDSANLPDPHILAREIADDLQSALEQIQDILGDLEERAGGVVD